VGFIVGACAAGAVGTVGASLGATGAGAATVGGVIAGVSTVSGVSDVEPLLVVVR
jgi:hypothetical protein